MTLVLASLAVGACALPHDDVVGSGARGSAELIGYFHYVGEFQIYPTREALRDRLSGDRQCISGEFANLQLHLKLSPRLGGKKVRLVGHYLEWEPIRQERIAGDPLDAMSALLHNVCHGKRVFIADDAHVVD